MTSDARVHRPLVVLLVAVVVVLVVAEGRAQAPPRRSLAGRLLVATDAIRDPRFVRTVIYLARHSEEGALGFVINVPMGEVPFERALQPLGVETPPGSGNLQVHYGGPVEPGQGFVLHTRRGSLAAREIAEYIEQWKMRMGVGVMEIGINTGINTDTALSFFMKCGYRPVGVIVRK